MGKKYKVTITETWLIDEEEVDKEDLRADLMSFVQDTQSLDWEMDYELIGSE